MGAQGQIEVLIENSSLRHWFCTIRIQKQINFLQFYFTESGTKIHFFCLALLILGPNHISSITVHNTIFFRFCRHYFLFWAKCFDDGFGRTTGFENWLPRILRTSFTSHHQLIIEFLLLMLLRESRAMQWRHGNRNCVVNGTIYFRNGATSPNQAHYILT